MQLSCLRSTCNRDKKPSYKKGMALMINGQSEKVQGGSQEMVVNGNFFFCNDDCNEFDANS